MRCLTSAKFNMKADILRQGVNVRPTDVLTNGEYVEQQDPLTHEIVRVWVPSVDDASTPNVDERKLGTIPCEARGIIDGGIRVAGTTERFGTLYENVDFVRLKFPAKMILTKRDRVTNIRDRKGNIIWLDEEVSPITEGDYRSTIFDVLGVTPILDPFGHHVENMAMLQRAEVYV